VKVTEDCQKTSNATESLMVRPNVVIFDQNSFTNSLESTVSLKHDGTNGKATNHYNAVTAIAL